MKKLFLALTCAVLTLSTVACNNEEDMPTPVSGQQNTIEASFPKGAKVKTLNVNVPDLQRTRAGEVANGLDYWSAFNNDTHDIKIRYAVYDDEDQLFYCSDEASEEVTTSTSSFNLKVPMPETENGGCTIFVWADKLGKAGHDNYQGYRIDWENMTVMMPSVSREGAIAKLSKLGDAWCCEADLNESTSNITLKRKMSQIILATDEFELKSIAEQFGNKSLTCYYWFGKEGEDNSTRDSGYVVDKWNWRTQEITFKQRTQFALFDCIPMEYTPFMCGNRILYPLLSAYYFSDYDKMAPGMPKSQHALNNINDIYFSVESGDFNKTIKCKNGQVGNPNVRLIFTPKHYSEGEGGIFTSGNGEIQCNIDQYWNTINTNF